MTFTSLLVNTYTETGEWAITVTINYGNAVLYLRKEYFSLLGGTYNGSCILQGYVDEKRLKTPDLDTPFGTPRAFPAASASFGNT